MSNIADKILANGREKKYDELAELVANTSTDELIEINLARLDKENALLNFTLMALSNAEIGSEKRFRIISAMLNRINEIELTLNKIVEIVTRINVDLVKLSTDQLIELVEYCQNSIKCGDTKCPGWKDLLPELITLLTNSNELLVNGIKMTGSQFRIEFVRSVTTMKWPNTILAPITSIFKKMPMTKEEKILILDKTCHHLIHLHPEELPPLSHQLFEMCTSAAFIMKPIFSLQNYFYQNYYKRLWEELSSGSTVSSFDDIDAFSSEEMRNSEDTIIFYLGRATEHCISEKELATYLKHFEPTPRYILTPFVISALLSMTNVNRYPDMIRSSSSYILPFLRNVVKNNDAENNMCRRSEWCRDILDRDIIDIDLTFNVLIDHGKMGNDVVTKGLVEFAFILLKVPGNDNLHGIAIRFLENFIKKRYKFGNGIITSIVNFLLADQNAPQYIECLTKISRSNTLTMTECVGTIKHILDYFLLIPGKYAMRMISFIIPLLQTSTLIRDILIEILRKAMYQSDISTRQLGVYGFCMILKQLQNNNAMRGRGPSTSTLTQLNISGYSLMSQSTLGNVSNPQRYFDMMTLEIIGILQRCLKQSYKIKETMYRGLIEAIIHNSKITPHIIEFLDWHFRAFFESDSLDFDLKFDIIVRQRGEQVEIWDHLGEITNLMGHCIIVCERSELPYNTQTMRQFFDDILKRIDGVTIEKLGLISDLDCKMNCIGSQFLNFLEALMSYCIWSANKNNNNLNYCPKLFKKHIETTESLKKASIKKKKAKKIDESGSTPNLTQISGQQVQFNPENIWNLFTLERFIRVIFSDKVSFATEQQSLVMRNEENLARYVLCTSIAKLEELRNENYFQAKHSKTAFRNFCQITRTIYEQCICKLNDLYDTFDVNLCQQCVECFRQCLLVINAVFKGHLEEFFKELTVEGQTLVQQVKMVINVIQSMINKFIAEENTEQFNTIVQNLLQCLQTLYDFIPGNEPEALQCYNWLYGLCRMQNAPSKAIEILFNEQVKTNFGDFFISIAAQIRDIFGVTNEQDNCKLKPKFTLNSINEGTVNVCTIHLCRCLSIQIEYVEYFIMKAKSFYTRIVSGKRSMESCTQRMKTTEKKICSQLVHIANTLVALTSARLPLGQCIDSLEKLIIQFYICITNFTKHLTLRHVSVTFSAREIQYELLLQASGRPLASRIYDLISYIEVEILDENLPESSKKKPNSKSDKAKVLRETKNIPKMIKRLENFNKFVLFLGKKTKTDLSHNLHIGTVRDFRISSKKLRDNINKTIQHIENTEIDENELEHIDANDDDDDDDDDDNNAGLSVLSSQESVASTSRSSNSSTINELADSDVTDIKLAMLNLDKINKKAKRKASAGESGNLLPTKRKTRSKK